jgi:hypothetical protein
MKPEFVAFPKIGKSFTRAFHALTNGEESEVVYEGFVKLHGTNAAIGMTKDGELFYQSRNRIITPQDDNAGFAQAMSQVPWQKALMRGSMIFGEWAGKGVQRKVAISEIEKTFYPFALYMEGCGFIPVPPSEDTPAGLLAVPHTRAVFCVTRPDLVGREIDRITLEVEAQCPVAFAQGVSGIGEGLVWRPSVEVYGRERAMNPETWFKSKGVQHEVKERIPSDKTYTNNEPTDAFLIPCIESRGSQGLDYLREMFGAVEAKHTGDFIKWVIKDIEAEETIPEDVNMKRAGTLAAVWFKAHGVK